MLTKEEAAVKKMLHLPEHGYTWNHNSNVSPLSIAGLFPLSNLPSFKWIIKVAERILEVLANNEVEVHTNKTQMATFNRRVSLLKGQVKRKRVNLATLSKIVSDITEHGRVTAGNPDRPQNIEEYAQLFQVIGLPGVSTDFNQDSIFSSMRTSGPNPLLIERLTKKLPNFPVTNKQYQFVMPGDSLEAALKDGRLYICDYKLLHTIQADATVQPVKYNYVPIALFAVHKNTGALIPVAIQTQQKPSSDNPIYIADGSYDWLMAKTIVEMADGNFHELVSHLGRTHLYIEPFVVATGRNFSKDHPIMKLLLPHFEGTIFINFLAVNKLIAPGGAVEQLLDGTLESLLETTVAGVEDNPFNEAFLPETFAARGVNDLQDYAFRDDASLYWEAISKWVKGYLDKSLTTPIGKDPEIQAWYNDLVSQDGGRVKGFGEKGGIRTKGYLTKALTMMIYTSSVQHAAVNFPQYNLMSYCPNMPLASYTSFPKKDKNNKIIPATSKDYLNLLPTTARAKTQLDVGATLGGIYYTELGQYEANQFNKGITIGPLKKFQADIKGIGETIQERNTNRRPYETLLPEGIPQSINI